MPLYSEHLSYCSDDGHLYDLLPIPFTDEAVHHTAARIAQVQDLLARRIAVENVSYYLAPEPAMDELAFTNAVLAEADCDLLLDVNNVYVNACNHGYDADAFIAGLPADRIVCLHVAGHLDEAPDLKIDTHGSAVIDPVWALLARTYARIGARPTLLERDFNFRPTPSCAANCRPSAACRPCTRRLHMADTPTRCERSSTRSPHTCAIHRRWLHRPGWNRAASRCTSGCCSTTCSAC